MSERCCSQSDLVWASPRSRRRRVCSDSENWCSYRHAVRHPMGACSGLSTRIRQDDARGEGRRTRCPYVSRTPAGRLQSRATHPPRGRAHHSSPRPLASRPRRVLRYVTPQGPSHRILRDHPSRYTSFQLHRKRGDHSSPWRRCGEHNFREHEARAALTASAFRRDDRKWCRMTIWGGTRGCAGRRASQASLAPSPGPRRTPRASSRRGTCRPCPPARRRAGRR